MAYACQTIVRVGTGVRGVASKSLPKVSRVSENLTIKLGAAKLKPSQFRDRVELHDFGNVQFLVDRGTGERHQLFHVDDPNGGPYVMEFHEETEDYILIGAGAWSWFGLVRARYGVRLGSIEPFAILTFPHFIFCVLAFHLLNLGAFRKRFQVVLNKVSFYKCRRVVDSGRVLSLISENVRIEIRHED